MHCSSFISLHLSYFVTVSCLARLSDTGICLLKYVFGIASVGGDVFSRHSYDDDGHKKAIAIIELCTFDANDLTLTRLDIVRLMCGETK